ncbi:MAG: tyrosine-type recombinase/integrase [Candidatus Anammoxibacter sp.]
MYKRGGVWWTHIKLNGKNVQKSLKTSDKGLAKSIEAKIRLGIAEGTYLNKPKGDKFTISSLVSKYLDEHSKPNKGEITYKNDISFSKRIVLYFGKMLINDVKPSHISEFITERRFDGASDILLNHELRLLRHAYNLAIRNWELVDESPFTKIKIPSGDIKRVRYLSEDEEKRLMTSLPEWLKPIVTIAMETGLRLSNITNLQWSQVNIFSKMIILETTKNGEPHSVPMTENVFNTIMALYKKKDGDYVFGYGANGKPFRKEWVSKNFRGICKEAGIKNFRFHDLRHDFCSKLVQKGADLYSVPALAGHKSIRTTQRYAHLSPEKLRSTIQILDSGYKSATVDKTENQQKVVNC